jgi:hypothetical protein
MIGSKWHLIPAEFVVNVKRAWTFVNAHIKKDIIMKKMKKYGKKAKSKIKKVMTEFKEGKLHSGSKKGPEVTNPKQAIAIGISEARKKGDKVPKKPMKKPMKKKK